MKSENIFLAMNGVDEKLIADCDTFYENSKVTKIHKSKFYLISSIAAILALSVFSLVCISHPAFAKDIPLVGNIFSQLGYKLGFGGEYDNYATPISSDETGQGTSLSDTADGNTLTLQDIYCDEKSMYISVEVKSKDSFPIDQMYTIGDIYRFDISDSKVNYSFVTDSTYNWYYFDYIEGEFADEHTFEGYIKADLDSVLRYIPDDEAQSNQFVYDSDVDWKYYTLPDNFTVDVTINRIIASIDNPENDNLSNDERASLPYPNEYENWWIDGPWSFTFDVNVTHGKVLEKTLDVTGLDSGFDKLSVSLSPFELVFNYDTEAATDYVVVAADANGRFMESMDYMDTIPVLGYDTSSVTIYICDYDEYMDSIKGQLLDENGEVSDSDCRDILENNALYSQTISFGE